MNEPVRKLRGARVTVGLMGLFGLVSLLATGAILFNVGGAREQAGHYVPVVVWMNFFAAVLYLIAAYGLLKHQPWTPGVILIAAVLLVVAAIGFYVHVQGGGDHEPRTMGALAFRFFATMILYAAARYYVRPSIP